MRKRLTHRRDVRFLLIAITVFISQGSCSGACSRLVRSRWEGDEPPDFSNRQTCSIDNPKGCEAACKQFDQQACDTIAAAKALCERDPQARGCGPASDAGSEAGAQLP